jgi:pSer/pThr/pTyr-binding forkhead associated (FHA) protein
MPRCAHCGKNNQDGAVFCQECGHRLDEKPISSPGGGAAAGALTCGSCGAPNAPGMNFCKMCGSALAPRSPAGSGPGAPEQLMPEAVTAGKISCPACQKTTPGGFAFCQHCGSRLSAAGAQGGMAMPGPSGAAPGGALPLVSVMEMPTPAAGMPVLQRSAAVGFAPTVASPTPLGMPAPRRTISEAAGGGTQAYRAPRETGPVHGCLVVLRPDGSDGDAYPVRSATFDIGRTEGSLTFVEDFFLAPRHARFTWSEDGIRVQALDLVNGVYVRLREFCELGSGDQFLMGKELLRFEAVGPEEREPPVLIELGVKRLGTKTREAWGRLHEVSGAGTTRNVWYLTRTELVFGREEGDVLFPDDEFISRRHALLRRGTGGGKVRLEDLGSSNGTFVRIRGEFLLAVGDVLRLGDQLLRVES